MSVIDNPMEDYIQLYDCNEAVSFEDFSNAYNEIMLLKLEIEALREFKRKHDEQLEKCYGKYK